MGDQMRLQTCTNGFVVGEMPVYGQLGCTGFIVLDATHQIVSKCTSSFMRVRELAFRHVDSLVDLMQSGSTALPAVFPGEYARLGSVSKRSEMNGKVCLCVGISPCGSEQDWIEVIPTSGSSRQPFRINSSNVVEKVRGADQVSCLESILEFALQSATRFCPMLPQLMAIAGGAQAQDEDDCSQDCDVRNKLLSKSSAASSGSSATSAAAGCGPCSNGGG
jgi:hypothetical protein